MCCCADELTRRRWMWTTVVGSLSTMVASWIAGREALAAPAPSAAALQVLKDRISVDVHSHGGPNNIISRTAAPSDELARAMRAGGLAAVCLADVPDGPLLGRNARGVLAATRSPAPGELYRYHLDRLDWLDKLVSNHGVRRALTVQDLRSAHAAGQPTVIGDIEGLDFLEGKLERIEESYRRGIRHVQLVHYTPNDIGDFQTGDVTHNGLTPFGVQVIQECNRLGLVIDVAHGTEDMVKQAAKATGKPLLLSHTALQGSKAMGATPLAARQVSPDHARVVAATGGAIGIWHFFPGLERYVDGLKEMVEVVGVDHVCVGTDQQTTAGVLQDYGDFGRLVDVLLHKGFTATEAGKLAGENYLRIFAASTAGASSGGT
jgi:membrane dipeptidase